VREDGGENFNRLRTKKGHKKRDWNGNWFFPPEDNINNEDKYINVS